MDNVVDMAEVYGREVYRVIKDKLVCLGDPNEILKAVEKHSPIKDAILYYITSEVEGDSIIINQEKYKAVWDSAFRLLSFETSKERLYEILLNLEDNERFRYADFMIVKNSFIYVVHNYVTDSDVALMNPIDTLEMIYNKRGDSFKIEN